MVERKEVEELLAYVEMKLESDEVELPPSVSDATLAALCRAWLAVQDAPAAEVTWDAGSYSYLVFDGGPEEMRGCRWNAHMSEQLDGQRVRIVKEGE